MVEHLDMPLTRELAGEPLPPAGDAATPAGCDDGGCALPATTAP